MKTPSRSPAFAAVLLTSAALAQSPDDQIDGPRTLAAPQPIGLQAPQDESSVPALATARADSMFNVRTRIHTAPDDPEGGAYGTWASGGDYKVSFHDRFTFVPYLGATYPHNQPWTWRTTNATLGGTPIARVDLEPIREHTDFRYEYHFQGGLIEAYDVRVEGVEQTFVLKRRPAGSGDLVITGAVESQLQSATLLDQHGELVFADQNGRDIMRYGAAIAFDADGRRVDVTTSHESGTIMLRVPEEWLAAARYPVTIDPLLTRECIAHWNSVTPAPRAGTVLDVEIGRDDIANDVMIAYTRYVSATDEDLWVWLFDDDDATVANRYEAFTDITTSWGSYSPSIAFAGGAADSWVVAFNRLRVSVSGTNGIRYHIHASGDTTASTSYSTISRPAGSSHGIVDVGGVTSFATSPSVFLVYERDDTGSNTDVFGTLIDIETNTRSPEVLIDSSPVGTSYTRARPNINQVASSGTDGWVVAYQEYWDDRPGGVDDWDINLRRIDGTGTPIGATVSTPNATPDDIHKLTPVVEGAGGRYAIAITVFAESPMTRTTTTLGTDIFNQTILWPVNGIRTSVGFEEVTVGLVNDQRWRVTDNALDTNLGSIAACAFESTVTGTQYLATTGFDAGLIERSSAYSPGSPVRAFGGSVVFNDDDNVFHSAYATNESGANCAGSMFANHTVYSHKLEHLAAPWPTRFGTRCGPGTITYSGTNLAGHDRFVIELNSAVPSVPCALFMGALPAGLPLDLIGMPGCFLNVNPVLTSIPMVTTAGGAARMPLQFPTTPLFCGTLHWQWVYVAPGLNPLGVATTEGLTMTVTCP